PAADLRLVRHMGFDSAEVLEAQASNVVVEAFDVSNAPPEMIAREIRKAGRSSKDVRIALTGWNLDEEKAVDLRAKILSGGYGVKSEMLEKVHFGEIVVRRAE